MQRVTGIGGAFIRGRDAKALRDWYAEHLGITITEWGGQVFHNGPGSSVTWSVVDRVEESELGRFGWAVDPEGNRFELWQPPVNPPR